MSNTIEELIVELGIDTEDGIRNLKKFVDASEKTAEESKNSLTGMVTAFSTGFLAMRRVVLHLAKGFAGLVNNLTATGDQIAKNARAAALGVEEYQRLSFAFERSGVSAEEVGKTSTVLQKNLFDLQTKGTGPAAEALAEMSIGLDDLLDKPFEQQLGVIADEFAKIEDEQKKAALAGKLFGEEAGPRLASLLAEGSDGIEALGQEAESLGLVMGEDATAQSEAFQDSVTNLKATFQGLIQTIGAGVIPEFKNGIDAVKDWIGANKEMLQQRVQEFIQKLVQLAHDLGPTLAAVAKSVLGLVEGFANLSRVLGEGTGVVALVGALALSLGGLPTLFVGAAAAGVWMGHQLVEALAPVESKIATLENRIKNAQESTNKIQTGRNALDQLMDRQTEGTLGDLSRDEFEALAESALRAGNEVSPEGFARAQRLVENFSEDFEEQRARKRDLTIEETFAPMPRLVAETKQIGANRKALGLGSSQDKPGSGGSGGLLSLDRLTQQSEAMAEIVNNLRTLGENVGATDQAVRKAANAAFQSIKGGSSVSVASAAGRSTLESLTGTKIPLDFSEFDKATQELIMEIQSLGREVGATDTAIEKATEAAIQQIRGGAVSAVAEKAARGVLSQLTGVDIPDTGVDPILAQLLGKQTTKGDPLPKLQASPTVVVTVNNFEANFRITETGNAQTTARTVRDEMRAFLFEEVGRAHDNISSGVVR